MSSLSANDPYGQITLPYQPAIERIDPILSQQKQIVFPPNTSQAGSSQNKTMRSSPASTSRRISKAEALTIVHRCKKWLIGGSLVSFGILTALVIGHTAGMTSTQAIPATKKQIIPVTKKQITPISRAPTTSSFSDGGFFHPQQQGGKYGGYGFGNSNSLQPSVSSSGVS